MTIYLEVAVWWLIVPALAVASACGLWRICANGWQAFKLGRQWADEAGAGVVPQASSDTGPGITAASHEPRPDTVGISERTIRESRPGTHRTRAADRKVGDTAASRVNMLRPGPGIYDREGDAA